MQSTGQTERDGTERKVVMVHGQEMQLEMMQCQRP